MLDPEGRVVMVSGANRGIGRAIARGLMDKGYRLSLGARDIAGLQAAFPEGEGEKLSLHPYDAASDEAPRSWVEASVARHGRIDALVNNAGIFHPYSLLDPDEAPLDELWSVNVKGPLRLIRAAWPHLKATGSGRVVNLASMSGKRVANEAIGYSMSKYAVIALTHQVRFSGWDHGIRATAICPGFVSTDMAHGITQSVPGEDMTQPEDIAEMVATLIALPNTAGVPEVTFNWRYEGVL